PVWSVEHGQHLRDSLSKSPSGDDVGDCYLVDIPPLQFGEEIVDLHFFSPTIFCTSASNRGVPQVVEQWIRLDEKKVVSLTFGVGLLQFLDRHGPRRLTGSGRALEKTCVSATAKINETRTVTCWNMAAGYGVSPTNFASNFWKRGSLRRESKKLSIFTVFREKLFGPAPESAARSVCHHKSDRPLATNRRFPGSHKLCPANPRLSPFRRVRGKSQRTPKN